MNKVVKEHIPVERLPEELRRGFAAGEIVEVEVRSLAAEEAREPTDAGKAEEAAEEAEEITLEAWLERHWAEHGRPTPLPPEEVERRGRLFDRFFGSHAHLNTSVEEAVARIRALRDEDD